MKKLSFKFCNYKNCTNPHFEGTSGQKYCNEHRNKICRKCTQIKEDSLWNKRTSLCRKCESKRVSIYLKNKRLLQPDVFKTDKIKKQKREQRKNYIKRNPDKIKQYYNENKEKIKVYQKKYYQLNRDKLLIQNKKWINNNYYKHRKMNADNSIKWRSKNKHIVAWRNILHRVLNKFCKVKDDRTIKLLGYSAKDLKENIENKFTEGMSWDNYGKWHIDHIKMVSSFPIYTDVKIVNSLTNLRPMWAKDNLSRKRKYIEI
jgi:hypothetical protein